MGANLGCGSALHHNKTDFPSTFWTPSGETIGTMLAQIDEPELLKNLPKDGATINYPNTEGETPLHIAVRTNNLVVAELLLNMGANTYYRDRLGRTPLHLACCYNFLEMAKLLIDNGADITGTKSYFHHGITSVPLPFVALEHDAKECFQLLLEHSVDPNTENNADMEINMSLLLKAAGLKKHWAVPLLLEYGADINKADSSGRTAPYIALWMNDCKLVELFLIKGGLDPNVVWAVPGQCSPLCVAAKMGCFSCVKLIISAGGKVNFRGSEGLSPLHYALGIAKDNFSQSSNATRTFCSQVYTDIAAYLITMGADIAPIWTEGIWDERALDSRLPHKLLVQAYSFQGFQTIRMQTLFRAVVLKKKDELVRLIVQAGYTPTEEDVALFNGRGIPRRPTGYDNVLNHSRTRASEDESEEDSLLSYLNHCRQTPKSLLNLAVVTVRKNLQHNVLWGVEQLPIPKAIKNIISFEVDLVSTNAQCL